MENKVKTAVIGYGHLGKWHCEKTAELDTAELLYIVEENDERRKLAQEKFPFARVTKDLLSILPEVEACLIITPTSTHFDYLKLLVEAGKHVFCEKPLCASWSEAQEIEKLLMKKDLILQVGHSERFHEVWESLGPYEKFMKTSGMVRIDRVAPFKGRATDVDVVNDLMIHDLDLLVYLFQEIPLSVTSIGFKSLTDKWDYVESTLDFHSSRKAILTVHRNDVKEIRQVALTNSLGHMLIDLFSQELFFANGREGIIQKKTFAKRDHLYLEQEHFFNSILKKKRPIVSFQEGILAVKLVSRVLESLETKKTVFI